MIDDPLAVDGVVQWTVARALPALAVTAVGLVGAPTVIGAVADDGGPVPQLFDAATVKV